MIKTDWGWRRLIVVFITVCVMFVGGLFQTVLAAAPPSGDDPALAAWASQRVQERPGVPRSETRSKRQGAVESQPALATHTLMTANAVALPVSKTMALAQPLAADVDNMVYAIDFTASDGSRQQFAAHYRPDDARPLYLCASGYTPVAGAGFEQARAAFIERVLGGYTEGLRVTALESLFTAADHHLRAGRNTIQPPWPRCWVFFVDESPLEEWEHPCRYVFVAEDLSAFAVQYGRSLLEAFAANGDRVLFKIAVPHPLIKALPSPLPAALVSEQASQKLLALDYSGSGQNCYAVIISGGANSYNNWGRYWNNCSQIYSTLLQKYHLPEDHITILMSDGTNPANDRNIGDDVTPVYVNTDPDLDQDGDDDINFSCTHANVLSVLNNLQATLTANDQLFIYITDHGYQESGHDAGANLWNWEELRDDELEDLTDNMACHVLITMGTCYAGGFIDDFAASVNNRALAVSCNWDETTSVGSTYPNYTQWLYYFTSGVRGFFPAAGPTPYQDGSACDADADNDGQVDFHEAWTYATAHKPASNDPQYEENLAGFGDTVYMNHLHIELNNNSPVSYSQIPKDFSFQVAANDWAAVGVASGSDHDIKADDNRQLTSPYRSSSYVGTTRDFVVANGHRLGAATHYAQVYYGAASAYNVEAEWLPVSAVLGGTHNYTASANEVFDLIEANLVAGTSYDVTLHITSGTPDLGVYVYSASADNGSRNSANWSRNTGGAGVDETLTFRATASGYHGIVMVNETGGSGNYTITIAESPPLAAPTGVAATDGTYTNRIRVTWNSVASATHYKVYRNTVNNSGSATVLNDWTAGTTYDDLTATVGHTYYYWIRAAASDAGDRESAFSASNGGYVLPTTLSSDVKVTASSDPTYYRAGGVAGSNSWWAVGVRRNVTNENWSMRFYDGPGFANVIETSTYTWPVDFVVVDGNHDGFAYRGVETYRFSGSGSASVEFEGHDTNTETLVVNSTSSWPWAAGDVVEMFEVPLAAGTYRFTLHFTSGSADLDFSLFGSGDGDNYRNRESYLARAIDAGAGADETFIYTVTAADDYGLCVWANDGNSNTYTLAIEQITSGIWEGDVSTNWFTTANWLGGVIPTAVLDATIPAGTPYAPTISSNTANCRDLLVASGATLTIGSATQVVARDVHLNGQLRMSYGNSLLDAAGSIYWHAGSTADFGAPFTWPDIQLDGLLVLEDGTSANLTGAHFQFRGGSPSYIRVFDADCVLGWVENLKDATTYLGLSAMSTEPCRINYLYNARGHTFTTFSDQDIRIGNYINNDGHLQLDQGVLAFTGNCSTNYPLTLTPGDYLNNLAMLGTGTLLFDATYTNIAPIHGSVEIASGKLDGSDVDLEVGGNWSNAVGAAGFNAGTRRVIFNGVGVNQSISGTNLFYNLVDGRSGSDQLEIRGNTTVQHDFTVGYQTAVWAPLDVQGTLNISNPACQLILWGSAAAQAATLDLGGELLVYSGSLTADDLLDNGLYGYIDIRGGHVTFTQGSGSGEWFDLYGTLKMTGGRLDLVGGGGDHYWPFSGACVFTMNGGILDFQDHGWRIRSGFSGGVTNGTLRCAGNVITEIAGFTPTGGSLELYGDAGAMLQQAAGSTFPTLLVNKNNGVPVGLNSDLTVIGDVEIRGGALEAYTYTLSVSGNWSNGVGTAGFAEDRGTVRFLGGADVDLQTEETFYRLELAKTYAGFDALEIDHAVHVLNDLVLTDGSMELNSGGTLDVDRDISIANGAGLNANDAGPLEIYVGRHWSNLNTNYSTLQGFDPGYDSLVVFDGGAVTGNMSTAASEETFDAVRIDRPGGTLRVLDAVTLRDDLTVLNGSFSYLGGPFTHHLRGDLTIESGAAWNDTVSTVVFDGAGAQSLNHKSLSGWFKHMIVEKSTGIGIIPLTLQSDVLLLGDGTLTVREGYMDLNGHFVRCTGNVTVENGGKLLVDAGAELEVGQTTLEIQSGGLLDVRGVSGNPATVQAWNGGTGLRFAFLLRSGAVLRAENAVFEYLDAGGLQVQSGATVEEPFTFHNCAFRYGTAGGTLLDLQNNQSFTIRNAVFPSNAGGGASNVRKTTTLGSADFVHATGVFAGESYDDDTNNLVDWHTGSLAGLSLAGPTVATMGGAYDFTATATGDMPFTPITYRWTMTDQLPATHSHGNLTDSMPDCLWTTSGVKMVLVTASNELGMVQTNMAVDVQVLTMDEYVGFHWTGTTNAVDLMIEGTSSNSTYCVEYRTNMITGDWINAAPGGLIVQGLNGKTPWIDVGGPTRDVTTTTTLFYRARLLP